MPKYIDAETLEKEGWWLSRAYQQDATTNVFETKKMTDFPTVDVVEVVRCKDCEYGKLIGECFYCTYEGHIHTDKFYCAHGEKKVYKPWELKK